MKKEFTPIAMRCTQEQFEAIKPKLEKFTKEINSFGEMPYLTNFLFGIENNIANIYESAIEGYDREVFEEWSEKVFLQACGIQTEQEYTITKSQLLELKNGYKTEKLREWFPEVFKTVLEVGKWYKVFQKDVFKLFCFNGKFDEDGDPCGFGFIDKSWMKDDSIGYAGKFTEAAESEVFEALKNEAVKRGFKEGAYFKGCAGFQKDEILKINGIKYASEDNGFSSENIGLYDSVVNSWFFHRGQWAEIIPTITKEDAEKELGKKILN